MCSCSPGETRFRDYKSPNQADHTARETTTGVYPSIQLISNQTARKIIYVTSVERMAVPLIYSIVTVGCFSLQLLPLSSPQLQYGTPEN